MHPMTKMKDGIHIPKEAHEQLVQHMLLATATRPTPSLVRRIWPIAATAVAASLALVLLLPSQSEPTALTEELAWDALESGRLDMSPDEMTSLLGDDEFETLLADLNQPQ